MAEVSTRQYTRRCCCPLALDAHPPLNTILILPECDKEIMRGMFELFDEVANGGCILRVCILVPCVCVVIQDATSDK